MMAHWSSPYSPKFADVITRQRVSHCAEEAVFPLPPDGTHEGGGSDDAPNATPICASPPGKCRGCSAATLHRDNLAASARSGGVAERSPPCPLFVVPRWFLTKFPIYR